MPTITVTTRKKTAKPAARTAEAIKVNTSVTGLVLLKDMKAYHERVAATPKSARDFLTRLGVLTPKGKAKTLIRG